MCCTSSGSADAADIIGVGEVCRRKPSRQAVYGVDYQTLLSTSVSDSEIPDLNISPGICCPDLRPFVISQSVIGKCWNN